MKDKFEELLDAVKRNMKYCPYVMNQATEEYVKNISEEIKEVIQAIKNNDNNNLQEELGDVFWDLLMTIHIAELEGRIDPEKVIENVIQKFKERKPFIFEGRTPPIKEVWEIWNKAKAKQKNANK